ncbi:unnamed protein product [Rangifer tarandus platyrhynchus]|uniref:Uncharacterized protein n=1 Tax=Rangifer tarandus platyrhynchus TaxID=3082113 RepID=A0AC59YDN7_RANTA
MGDAAGSPGGRPCIVCEARAAPEKSSPHPRASGLQAWPDPSLPTGLGARAPAPGPRGGSLPHAPAPGGGARQLLLGPSLCHRPREPRGSRTPPAPCRRRTSTPRRPRGRSVPPPAPSRGASHF